MLIFRACSFTFAIIHPKSSKIGIQIGTQKTGLGLKADGVSKFMLIKKLTDRAIASKVKPGLYGDGGNLFLRVAAGGSKSWVYRYWYNERRHALGLGAYPQVSLKEARDLADDERRLRRTGDDPATVKRAKRAAQRVAEAKAMTE